MQGSQDYASGPAFSRDRLQFYVTPPELAARVWERFKNRAFDRVLDAFSGTGALSEAAPHTRHNRHRDINIDCVEVDASKHPILRDKGLTVVGLDFFAFEGGEVYSHVVMNPPFAQGARAVLKAWDMLWEGEVTAIINAETVRNPFSAERARLVALVEEHGSVEFIADAFQGAGVEREANVEIALVHLVKPAECARDWIGDLLASMAVDKNEESDLKLPGELALPASFVETQCAAFRAAVKAMRESVRMEAVATHYTNRIGHTMAELNGSLRSSENFDVRKNLETRYGGLKDRAWTSVLRSTETLTRLSQKVQRQAESQFESIKKLDFTESNVYGFLLGLVESQPEMQLDMACDVFDTITRYHSENTVFYRGWKSNDKHRTCGMRIRTTRFVLPGHRSDWGSSPRWETQQLLADFDKVFAMLDGKRQAAEGLCKVFTDRYSDLKHGQRVSSSYFDIRYYPGAGTIHFFARDKSLVDRLNRIVGRRRQWLPPESERVSDAFWLQFDQAEKLDKEVRAEVRKGCSRWDDPFRELMWKDGEGRSAAAGDKIAGVIAQVLAARGITLTLESAPSAEPQLLLAAA
jgi:predicted RNA methylase